MAKTRKWLGSRQFYQMTLGIALPIMVQNGISTFVNLLDNLMVGRLGTEAMSGVSIVNQFLFIFNLVVFGAVSAAGIFMAQFHGKGDREGEMYTFRFKFLVCLAVGLIGTAVMWAFHDSFIRLFLYSDGGGGDLELTFAEGKKYLYVMLAGLLPFAIANAYGSSMRETGDTVTPMVASIAAVAANFVLNYLLIFGSFGAPRLEVRGAAIATVVSRFLELAILVVRTHVKAGKYGYIRSAFRSFRIPLRLFRDISLRGLPLIANEGLWSLAVTLTNQCYATRGLDVVAASNIYSTIWNLFSVVFLSMGNAIAIVLGNQLGAGKLEEAKDTSRRLIGFSIFCSVLTAAVMASISGVFPLLYNTTDGVRELATYMIRVAAIMMPCSAFTNAAYFTIRSGGKVFVTMLFDSVFMWVVLMPIVFGFSRLTDIGIHPLFAIGVGTEFLKCLLGAFMLHRGTWVKQLA